MSHYGRIRIIPHPKPEPDLHQVVLAVMAMLDEQSAGTVHSIELDPTAPDAPARPPANDQPLDGRAS